MANPNNAIGTNGAFGGRTSVNAFNDIMNVMTRGIISGWSCKPSSGMTVALGGTSGTRDAAVAQDNSGNKTSINNISSEPISVTIPAAPASNSRIDAIVAYVSNPPYSDSVTDNPDACGLVVVSGTIASTPSTPTDSAIRTAITADGASGSTAYYAVLAYVTVRTGTTDISSNMISAGPYAQISRNSIADSAINTGKLASKAVTADKVDFATFMQSGTITGTAANGNTTVNVSLPKAFADSNYKVFLQHNTIANFGAMSLAVDTKSAGSFVALIYNTDPAAQKYSIDWLAVKI